MDGKTRSKPSKDLAASLENKLPRLLLLAFMVLFVVGPVTSLVLWMIKRGMTHGLLSA